MKGAEQIGFTIISLTVSLIAVLIPLFFYGRSDRSPLSRIRCHPGRHHYSVGGCLSHADADDVLTHSAAISPPKETAKPLLQSLRTCFRERYCILRAHAEVRSWIPDHHVAGGCRNAWCSQLCSISSFQRDFSPRRIQAKFRASRKRQRRFSFASMEQKQQQLAAHRPSRPSGREPVFFYRRGRKPTPR